MIYQIFKLTEVQTFKFVRNSQDLIQDSCFEWNIVDKVKGNQFEGNDLDQI